MSCRAPLVFTLVSLFLTHLAQAQEPAAAEALFDSGVAAMKAGRYDDACPKIEESHQLEARPGTLFTLAECWRKAGKTATALARYNEYLRVFERMDAAEQKRQRGRDGFARKHVASLEETVPHLVITLSARSPKGAIVLMNGVELGAAALGTPLPVDPGHHELVVRASDGTETTTALDVTKGESKSVELEVRSRQKAPEASRDERPLATAGARRQSQAKESNAPPSHGQRTAGWVLLGVGAASAVVGTVAGVLVLSKKSELEQNCGIGGNAAACNADGKREADSVQTLGLVSTVGFAVAIAGLGSGTTLLLTAPEPQQASRGRLGGSVALGGRF
ncbi:MAG: hypothetical protein R3B13_12460 [Polyangiaceae bacterium]